MAPFFHIPNDRRAMAWICVSALVLIQVIALCGVPFSYADEDSHDQTALNNKLLAGLTDKEVKHVQESLKVLGYEHDEAEGSLESQTVVALQDFAKDFKMDLTSNDVQKVIVGVFHFADIAQAHPDWKQIAGSVGF
ncbi:MAG: hypothetical protein GKS05_12900 [Nitrospirales bacterium]|nr:hypothetical protein [Nitrospirales bacterium]